MLGFDPMTETKPPAELETMHRLVNGCLRQNAPAIAAIGFSGDVAVVVHEPGEAAKAKARAIGWDGKSEVFRLTADGRRALAASTDVADLGVAKWLARKFDPASPTARIYVLAGDEPFLVNFSAFGGWAIEPPPTAGQVPS
jgi:hypothetical protein